MSPDRPSFSIQLLSHPPDRFDNGVELFCVSVGTYQYDFVLLFYITHLFGGQAIGEFNCIGSAFLPVGIVLVPHPGVLTCNA